MWPNPEETADLVKFTKEILNGKLHFLCSDESEWEELRMDEGALDLVGVQYDKALLWKASNFSELLPIQPRYFFKGYSFWEQLLLEEIYFGNSDHSIKTIVHSNYYFRRATFLEC